MLKAEAVQLVEFLQNAGYVAELYEDYSGRGMYGETTTGVTTDATPGDMEYLEDEMDLAEIDPPGTFDNMGLDFIYY